MGRRRLRLPTATDLAPAARSNGDLRTVPVAAISVDADANPRHRLQDIEQLADSIRIHGLLQPVVVRQDERHSGRYQLVAGYRRMAAIALLHERYPRSGWNEVSVVVHAAEAEPAQLMALVENLQRDDLSARDEAEALGRLVRERHWSTRQIASAIAKSQAYVSRRLRVYEDAALRPLVLRNELSVAIAEELLTASAARRPELAKQAVRERWDRRRARAEARGYTAAFHPHLRAQVSGLRELIASASLSMGERLMLRQFGEFLLAQVPAVEDTPPS